ncbi:internalin_A [Hexamita inflata]|uniref:Internalin A n=1 Tax=Hexamita inflata TaxID=28002 RepID=A0AA86TU37_9EUKA|nr:internalin A [Hexamita inflata]
MQKYKVIISNVELQTLSEYNKTMIEKYQDKIEYGALSIERDPDFKSLDFIRFLKIYKLMIYTCENIIPKAESQSIKKLLIVNCNIQSIKDFQLENLEVLDIHNIYKQVESKTLTLEIIRFQKLKELYLGGCIIDIGPLSQKTRLTKLSLSDCSLRSTQVLQTLINLVELYLNDNKEIEITSLQYLTKLTKLSLASCGLVNLDALRPLKYLQELDIRWNQIVYVQPLTKLKYLSILDADNNMIIDIQTVKQHLNINIASNDQDQPTEDQIKATNKLRDINSPITFLKQICKQSRYIKQQNIIFRQKITQLLQITDVRHEQCLTQVTFLFQKMNTFGNEYVCQ